LILWREFCHTSEIGYTPASLLTDLFGNRKKYFLSIYYIKRSELIYETCAKENLNKEIKADKASKSA